MVCAFECKMLYFIRIKRNDCDATVKIGNREKAMSYVNENFMPNEKVLFSARIHPDILFLIIEQYAEVHPQQQIKLANIRYGDLKYENIDQFKVPGIYIFAKERRNLSDAVCLPTQVGVQGANQPLFAQNLH